MTYDFHVSLDVKIFLTKSRQAQRQKFTIKKANQGTVPGASCSPALFYRNNFSLQNLGVLHHTIVTNELDQQPLKALNNAAN